jgi:ribulose-5-phosphate 4-epimerase/fuculose-1-phosphate aldolase
MKERTIERIVARVEPDGIDRFAIRGSPKSETMRWFQEGLVGRLVSDGYRLEPSPRPDVRFVLNLVEDDLQAFRRKAQRTFVMSVLEMREEPADVLRAGYPFLVRTLSNLATLLVHTEDGLEAHFLTPEQGHYTVRYEPGEDERFFLEVHERVDPLASSQLVVNNIFRPDLEPELWEGDEITEQIKRAGERLDSMNLLPAPFPIEEYLSERELRHVYRLYGLGGLSYGNISARKDAERFWMSASGVNKGRLEGIGQDILLVTGYEADQAAMVLSVPPDIRPKRVSVDAIEHWMIYCEHPDVGAIVHVHAWMEGIRATPMNYPCGTMQIGQAVAELLRAEPNASRAVIGLRNHGVTITGPTMEDVLERIEGRILRQVPMS